MGYHPSHWLSLHYFSRWWLRDCTTNQIFVDMSPSKAGDRKGGHLDNDAWHDWALVADPTANGMNRVHPKKVGWTKLLTVGVWTIKWFTPGIVCVCGLVIFVHCTYLPSGWGRLGLKAMERERERPTCPTLDKFPIKPSIFRWFWRVWVG